MTVKSRRFTCWSSDCPRDERRARLSPQRGGREARGFARGDGTASARGLAAAGGRPRSIGRSLLQREEEQVAIAETVLLQDGRDIAIGTDLGQPLGIGG